MPDRSDARQVVLQLLYEDDLNPDRPSKRDEEFLRSELDGHRALIDFARSLLEGVRKERDQLDEALACRAQNWTIDRMAVTDRNTLRLGAFELLHTDAPGPVVVNESVEVAKRFGSSESAGFVNAILDRLREEVGRESTSSSDQGSPGEEQS